MNFEILNVETENHFSLLLLRSVAVASVVEIASMPSLHLNSDGGGQNRKHKAARPLKPSLEPLPSPAATSNVNGMKNAPPSRDGESAFCRALASGDPSTRLWALDALVAWLVAKGNSAATGSSVSRDDMRKLWKGMFYSYWHSDLAPVQVRTSSFILICMRRLERWRPRRCRQRLANLSSFSRSFVKNQKSQISSQKQLATRMAGIAGELHPEVRFLKAKKEEEDHLKKKTMPTVFAEPRQPRRRLSKKKNFFCSSRPSTSTPFTRRCLASGPASTGSGSTSSCSWSAPSSR